MAASLLSSPFSELLFLFFFIFTVTSRENTTNFSVNTTVFNDRSVTEDAFVDLAATQPAGFESTTPTPSTGEPSPTPEQLSPTPGEPSPTPKQPSPTPGEPSRTPEQLSPTPEQPSPTPKQPSPAPGEPSPTPEQPSPTPEQPSPTPEQPSPTPEQLSQTPGEPSPTPEQPSPTPEPQDPTTEQPSSAPEEPSPEPLPVSGRLPSAVRSVGRLCSCDERRGECDVNCCCDSECGEEAALFTGCSVDSVSENEQLCSRDVASYSLRSTMDGFSEIQSSVRKENSYDVLCIQSQNRVDGFAHPSPALPTDSSFDSLFRKFTGFFFGSEESREASSELQDSLGYEFGDVMLTAAQGGSFMLPAPGVTADCVDNSPAGFLKDQSSRCSRRVVLDQDCVGLRVLNMKTYSNIQLLSGKGTEAVVVPVELSSVVLQSVEGSQSELQIDGDENFDPVLMTPTLCANVVLKVRYTVKYNESGEILNASVSLVLGFMSEEVTTLEQEFGITFVQEDEDEDAVRFSGSPGYVFGLPLVSGTRTAEGISRSVDPTDTLSLLHSNQDQDCLRGRHQRSPVLFGVDSASGCTLRLEEASNCSLLHQVLLDVLRGPNQPQYVASFGNSALASTADWVPVKSNFNPGESQGCSIPLSLHLEVQWTKYGSLVNPQARIVSVKEIIRANSSSLALLSAGSSVLSLSTSVSFTSVSADARPGYRATPTINAKLPFDFFFPFV